MDGDGYERPPLCRSPNKRRSSKSKAPPPPVQKAFDDPRLSQRIPAYSHTLMEQKENLTEQDLTLLVVLPGGVEKTTVVPGSKPMMDLLVMLCAKYHLNPSSHTIELVSTNRNHIKFKPNAPIGALDAEKVLLKAKGAEDKNKNSGPKMPEATVRLVINYKKTQKTILRVNPRGPLRDLLPAICEKCEFEPQTTVLCVNARSEDRLDLSLSLNDFGLREVYARDTRVISPVDLPPSPTPSGLISPGKDKTQKERENKGLFSLFKRGSKKKSDQPMTVSAPVSPVLRRQRPLSLSALGSHCSSYHTNTMPSDTPKKRRAPLPPGLISPTANSDLADQPEQQANNNQGLSRSNTLECSVKKTKRKAPPPPTSPCIASPEEPPQDRGAMTGPGLSPTLAEIQEQEEIVAPASPVAPQDLGTAESAQEDSSSLNLSTDVSMDSGRVGSHSSYHDAETESMVTPTGIEEDLPCDLSSDGKLPEDSMSSQEPSALSPEPLDHAPPSEEGGICQEAPPEEVITQELCTASESGTPETGMVLDQDPITPSSQVEPPASRQTPPTPLPESLPREPPHSLDTETQTSLDITEDISSQLVESSSSLPSLPPCSPSIKKDVATFTEELNLSATQPTVSPPADMPECPGSAQSVPGGKGSQMYVLEPKPKPSNELTREYIPKVGMTTYTIVPQKSLEKLRYFEVELTLEPPHATNQPEGTEDKTECGTPVKDMQISKSSSTPESSENYTTTPLPLSPPSSTSPPAGRDSISSLSEDTHPTEIKQDKERKVPPLTKPKPASFRLPHLKRTSSDYVTSAAVRGGSSSPVLQKEGERSPVSPQKEPDLVPALESFPPPPPPVQWEEDQENGEKGTIAELKSMPALPASSRLIRQMSLPVREQPTAGLSLEKLRSFAAPKPYSPMMSSRFAQAVTSAVRRSQSFRHAPTGESPQRPPLYLHTGSSPITDGPKNTLVIGKGPDSGPGADSSDQQDQTLLYNEEPQKNGSNLQTESDDCPPMTSALSVSEKNLPEE